MKKSALCLSMLVLMSGISGFLYHKKTQTELKILSSEEDSDALYYVNERLQNQNRKLKREKKQLLAKLKRQRELMNAYRDAFRKERLQRIRRRLATVRTRSAPFTGMAVVAAAALDDAGNYCSDMRRMKNLESDFFGFSSEEGYESEICAGDLNETGRKIRQEANEAVGRFLAVDANDTDAVVYYWKEQINDGMASVSEGSERLKAFTLTMYEDLLDELNVSSDIRASLNETFNYWRYVFGL